MRFCPVRALPVPLLYRGATSSARMQVQDARGADHASQGDTLTIQVVAAGRREVVRTGPCFHGPRESLQDKACEAKCQRGPWSGRNNSHTGARVYVCVRVGISPLFFSLRPQDPRTSQ